MAIQVKDAGTVVAKWLANAGRAAGDYATGVKSPKVDWAQATVAGATNWANGVAAASADGRFARNVQKAGTGKWQAGATGKGSQRYSGGIQAGQANYQSGVAPVLQAIANVTLPPRGIKGDPNNVARVAAIATALHALKIGH